MKLQCSQVQILQMKWQIIINRTAEYRSKSILKSYIKVATLKLDVLISYYNNKIVFLFKVLSHLNINLGLNYQSGFFNHSTFLGIQDQSHILRLQARWLVMRCELPKR